MASDSNLLIVGTRDSILARLQTDLAIAAIKSRFPDLNFEIVALKTSGDKVLNKPLAELGGRGVFVKELEEALLARNVDFVVHSLKDLPTELPPQLVLAATLDRADPRDVLICKNATASDKSKFESLPANSRIATSSRRRSAQLVALRSDLQFVDIRGNIQTRLRKLDEGQCEAMILASAGIIRLGLEERISEFFEAEICMPAVGQGALGIECRTDNQRMLEILDAVNDKNIWACTSAERALLNELGGGCSVPVGALAKFDESGKLQLNATVAALDGKRIYRDTVSGASSDAIDLGKKLAAKLIEQGAADVIESLKESVKDLSLGQVSPP